MEHMLATHTLLAALLSGLIGGVFFAFSVFVMRGLAKAPLTERRARESSWSRPEGCGSVPVMRNRSRSFLTMTALTTGLLLAAACDEKQDSKPHDQHTRGDEADTQVHTAAPSQTKVPTETLRVYRLPM